MNQNLKDSMASSSLNMSDYILCSGKKLMVHIHVHVC